MTKCITASLASFLIALISFVPSLMTSSAGATTTGAIPCRSLVTYKLVNKIRTVVLDGRTVREVVTHTEVVKVHGRKVVKHVPVKVRQKTTTKVCTKPAAYLDPTFVQSGTNPLSVTWCASVNDNGVTSPCQFGNGTSAPPTVTKDPTLPSGVLDFYIGPVGSTTGLVCSTNVGPQLNYADCTVKIPQTGTYTVITEYLSGVINSSASEQDTINSFSTTTSASIASAPSQCPGGVAGANGTSYCDAWTISGSVIDQNGDNLGLPNLIASIGFNGEQAIGLPFPAASWTLVETATQTPSGSWQVSLRVPQYPSYGLNYSFTTAPDTWAGPTVNVRYLGTPGYGASSATPVTGTVAP